MEFCKKGKEEAEEIVYSNTLFDERHWMFQNNFDIWTLAVIYKASVDRTTCERTKVTDRPKNQCADILALFQNNKKNVWVDLLKLMKDKFIISNRNLIYDETDGCIKIFTRNYYNLVNELCNCIKQTTSKKLYRGNCCDNRVVWLFTSTTFCGYYQWLSKQVYGFLVHHVSLKLVYEISVFVWCYCDVTLTNRF